VHVEHHFHVARDVGEQFDGAAVPVGERRASSRRLFSGEEQTPQLLLDEFALASL